MISDLKWRLRIDRWATQAVSVGGIGVIAAVALIFFYLLYEVVPMFRSAEMHPRAEYQLQLEGTAEVVHLAVEEQGEYGLRISRDGQLHFFSTADGTTIKRQQLNLPPGAEITVVAGNDPDRQLLALGLSNGGIQLIEYGYRIRFSDEGNRQMTPEVRFPYGEQPIEAAGGLAISAVAIQAEEGETGLLALNSDGDLQRVQFTREESFLGLEDSGDVEISVTRLGKVEGDVCRLLMDRMQQFLYVAQCGGTIQLFGLQGDDITLLDSRPVVGNGAGLQVVEFVSGTYSILVGDSAGQVRQWFPVRASDGTVSLQQIREFLPLEGREPIIAITAEERRKGFAVLAADGALGLYNTTARRQVLEGSVDATTTRMVLAPRSNFLLLEGDPGTQQFWKVDNEHPEISWSALWEKVWYESYQQPEYIWQSSAATNDFEPKFSLTPLVFGTVKAAFYAMLFAMPIAILGAIYTGYFMHPRMRGLVKPAIENMEALPTVIIGFLAGLWLAPALEANLPGLFALLLITPLAVLAASLAHFLLPHDLRSRIPEGIEALLLIPYLLFICWLSFAMSGTVEGWLFGGDVRAWINSELGLDFDQRNSVVVGIAMGVAVIPTIFSMAEDAVFSVPKHLTQGSLALGATRWQTLSRVVILTASPGIFSAVMIGLGRAVGETMIVLMATGNTPVMDFNIFSGMRTLSANIAVEMPESEVGSTHFRVLFLAALVLFALTFVFNTAAEVVRQRLRERYSSL